MHIVKVSADERTPESHGIRRQIVVSPNEERLAIAGLDRGPRVGAVKTENGAWWELRMKSMKDLMNVLLV
jgi:hypothetical protein